MKKDYLLFNLEEAKEAIDQLISDINNDPDYDVGNYIVDMQHIYSHINSAWNGKDFDSNHEELTDELYQKFTKFPDDLEP